jgi:hypothetical protein
MFGVPFCGGAGCCRNCFGAARCADKNNSGEADRQIDEIFHIFQVFCFYPTLTQFTNCATVGCDGDKGLFLPIGAKSLFLIIKIFIFDLIILIYKLSKSEWTEEIFSKRVLWASPVR